MDEIVVRRFKERGAEYYRETREKILAAMVAGRVIHADETRIRLHGKVGYVWVFSTCREVVYFYSETREGRLVQSALGGFNGVLVTDFYTAYDSLPYAQQKCLLHLMRDLNDAVPDSPYNEDLKAIATAFAELLRGIVKTVDRVGSQESVPTEASGGRVLLLQANSEHGTGKPNRVEMEGSLT